jgi:hypothetical protein
MTVISHFRNEAYLLPWWLSHHKKIFDHGILIDYNSTDESVDIIRSLAPTWEIVKTRNQWFGAHECDQEVMDIERRVGGWKIALNTTEFLFCKDLKEKISNSQLGGFQCRGVYLADPKELHWVEANPNQPILKQRHWGFYERENVVAGTVARERLLHSHPDGRYMLGRHSTFHRSEHPDDLLCVWLGFSPFTEGLLQRRVQVQDNMPPHQKGTGTGWGHYVTRDELIDGHIGWNKYEPTIRDLRTDPIYGSIWDYHYGT